MNPKISKRAENLPPEDSFEDILAELGGEEVFPDDNFERAVFGKDNSGEMSQLDDLIGHAPKRIYGIHVGDAVEWIPILCRDYSRDAKDAKIMHISNLPEGKFFTIPDPNPMDKGSVPDSMILCSTESTIPSHCIRFESLDKETIEEIEKIVYGEDEDPYGDEENGY